MVKGKNVCDWWEFFNAFFFVACKGAAKMLFTGTLTLGCKSYIDSQTEACFCSASKSSYKNKNKYTTGAGDL